MGTITLINNETGEKFDFDLINCTRGPKAVDFSKLFERANIFLTTPGMVQPQVVNPQLAI